MLYLQTFIDDWPLFWMSWVAGWIVAALLSMVGVVVVARDQIFIGAAVSQASTMGIAAAMMLGLAMHPEKSDDHFTVTMLSVVFAVLASGLIHWRSGGGRGRESHEAITGWVFLTASAMAVLLVTKSPHGMEEVKHLLASSIIGADGTDLWATGLVTAATAAGLVALHRPLLLLIMDPETASAAGMRVRLWQWGLAVWMGVALGLALSVGGMLYTFGCLVLPAMVAKNVCREVRPMFIVAPAVGLGASLAAFVFAHHDDFPAQMAVALLGGLMLPAWIVRYVRR